jgi:hypothetical protein
VHRDNLGRFLAKLYQGRVQPVAKDTLDIITIALSRAGTPAFALHGQSIPFPRCAQRDARRLSILRIVQLLTNAVRCLCDVTIRVRMLAKAYLRQMALRDGARSSGGHLGIVPDRKPNGCSTSALLTQIALDHEGPFLGTHEEKKAFQFRVTDDVTPLVRHGEPGDGLIVELDPKGCHRSGSDN